MKRHCQETDCVHVYILQKNRTCGANHINEEKGFCQLLINYSNTIVTRTEHNILTFFYITTLKTEK